MLAYHRYTADAVITRPNNRRPTVASPTVPIPNAEARALPSVSPSELVTLDARRRSAIQGKQEAGVEPSNSRRKHTAFGQPALPSGIFNQYPETIDAVLSTTAFI